MNEETRKFLEHSLLKYLKKVPTSEEELYRSSVLPIVAVDVINELCVALNMFEDKEK